MVTEMPKNLKFNIIFVLLLSCLIPAILTGEEQIPITLEHAITKEQRNLGLMNRPSLAWNHGMTFNYTTPQRITIWMYNAKIDLAVAFLDGNKVIREIVEMKAYPEIHDKLFFQNRRITSSFDASYVLEMNKGWFEANGIKIGDQAVWSIDSPFGSIIKK